MLGGVDEIDILQKRVWDAWEEYQRAVRALDSRKQELGEEFRRRAYGEQRKG